MVGIRNGPLVAGTGGYGYGQSSSRILAEESESRAFDAVLGLMGWEYSVDCLDGGNAPLATKMSMSL